MKWIKLMLITAMAVMVVGCDSSKSVNITEIKGVQQMVKFFSLDETTYPVKVIYMDGGSYSNELFFPKQIVEVVTGEKYTITWQYEDTTSATPNTYKTVSRNNQEFNFGGVQIDIHLGNSESLFIPQE